MTENNESNGNTPTAFSPLSYPPRLRTPSTPLFIPLVLPDSLYLPPCSFSSVLGPIGYCTCNFIVLYFIIFATFRVSLLPGKGCEFPPFIYGTVITDVLTESNNRHKWARHDLISLRDICFLAGFLFERGSALLSQ